MYVSTEAVYDKGVLRPVSPLPELVDGQRVILIVYDEAEMKQRERQFIEKMKAEGRIVQFPETAENAPEKFEPIKIEGVPLSQTILEERR